VLAIAVAVLWVRLLLDIPDVEEEPTPTVVVRTAVPTTPPPTATVGVASPGETTPPAETVDQPVATDEPTSVVPEGEIGVGVSVIVVAESGLFLRAQPEVGENALILMQDGTSLEVIGGPSDDGEFVWWQLRMDDGTEGWAVGEYLQMP
jgi:hypothetical protein